MSFWNIPSVDPKRKFRFLLQTPGWPTQGEDIWVWIRTVTKPSYEMTTGDYQLGNHKFKYPGVVTWNDVSITIVDMKDQTYQLYDNLKKMGWNLPGDGGGTGLSKAASGTLKDVIIQQLDAAGTTIEQWTLKGAFIKSVDFGQLSYADDEMVELTMGVSYDYAELILNPGAQNAADAAEAAGLTGAQRALQGFANVDPNLIPG